MKQRKHTSLLPAAEAAKTEEALTPPVSHLLSAIFSARTTGAALGGSIGFVQGLATSDTWGGVWDATLRGAGTGTLHGVVGGFTRGFFAGTIAPKSVARSNAQLVDDIGTRAQRWAQRKQLTGTPRQVGTQQHKYARDVLDRYQRMFGDRGLVTERSFIQGVEVPYGTLGSTRLDVLDTVTGNVWDYKFGVTPMSHRQIQRILQNGPGVNSVTPVYKP